MRPSGAVVGAVVAAALSAACAPAGGDEPRAPAHVPVADCGAPPPHELEDTVDTEGDFAADLAAVDAGIDALPDDIDAGALSALAHDMVAYMLEVPALGFTGFAKADARHTALGDVVLGAFASAAAAGSAGDVDVPFLRRGLFARYACARGQELELADFRVRFGVDANLGAELGYDDVGEGDANAEVVQSLPKHGPRRLSHVVAEGADVYLGQTLEQGDDGATIVRETEAIVVGLRRDGAVDFYAWDEAGDLMRSSRFATSSGSLVPGPVPFTCMACHRDADGGTGYTVVRP